MRFYYLLSMALWMSGMSLGGSVASAAEKNPTRIYYLGNSLTDQLKYDSFVKLAEAGGEKIVWGRHMCPGVPIHGLYGMKDGGGFYGQPFGPWGKALSEFEWDYMTVQPFGALFETQMQAAYNFACELAKKSPHAQVLVYAQWPGRAGRDPMSYTDAVDWDGRFFGKTLAHVPYGNKLPYEAPDWGLKDVEERFWYHKIVASLPPPLNETFQDRSLKHQYEAAVYALNQANPGKKPARLIPVGHVMQLLGQKMRAGLIPGYRTPWDFYSDGVHVNNDCSYLVACTFYATIFMKSPVGLPIGDYQGRPGMRADGVKISPELAKIIQETVWEVVATHPLTGVSANDSLKVASPLLDSAVVGEPYRFELLPAFGKAPHVWSLAKGKLPEGLTLTESGAITGTPTTAGNSELTLALTDAAGGKATASFTLKVEVPVHPVIPAQSIAAMSVGQFMEQTLRSEAGNGLCLWRVKQGSALPPGLTLDGYGRLWGAPGKEGRYEFTLEVVDGKTVKPGLVERAFTATVGPAVGEVALARRLPEKLKLKEEVDPSPWKFRYPIRKLVQGDQATVSGAFDLAWDDESLWVAVRVKDATNQPGVNWSPKFQGDNVVICLDGYNNREATYNADDRYLAYPRKSPYALPFSIGDRWTVGSWQKDLEDGYFVLFQVKFKGYGAYDWPAGSLPYRVIGLDLVLVDDAKDGVPKSTVVWQGTKDNATDPSKFGAVVLEMKP